MYFVLLLSVILVWSKHSYPISLFHNSQLFPGPTAQQACFYVGPIMFLFIIFCTKTLKFLISTVFYYVHFYVYKSIFVICDLLYNLLQCIPSLEKCENKLKLKKIEIIKETWSIICQTFNNNNNNIAHLYCTQFTILIYINCALH